MATKESMVDYINSWLTHISNYLAKTSGPVDNMLFVDNAVGLFSFSPGLAVGILHIVTTSGEVERAKALLATTPDVGKTMLVNQVTQTLDTLNVATGVWTATTVGYADASKPERVVYSPWSRRVWITNTYGVFKRQQTTGMTLVG